MLRWLLGIQRGIPRVVLGGQAEIIRRDCEASYLNICVHTGSSSGENTEELRSSVQDRKQNDSTLHMWCWLGSHRLTLFYSPLWFVNWSPAPCWHSDPNGGELLPSRHALTSLLTPPPPLSSTLPPPSGLTSASTPPFGILLGFTAAG